MTLLPHNHNMFAVIGLYGGREDNMFWRRLPDEGNGAGPALEAAGAESMGPGQAATLGPDIIHSVANPIAKLTSALHVYGGDFFNPPTPRSQAASGTTRACPSSPGIWSTPAPPSARRRNATTPALKRGCRRRRRRRF